MSENRQLSLFAATPVVEAEITRYTKLRDTVTLFQRRLIKDGKTEHTVNAFTSDLHLLGEFSGEGRAVGEFTTLELNDFLDWLEKGRGIPCSRKSYARRVTTVKVYFKWLTEIGALEHDPAHAVLQRSGQAPLAIILTDEQVNAAMHHGASLRHGDKPDTRPQVLFWLLLDTGIKKNETMRLTADDIDRTQVSAPILRVRHTDAKNVYKERLIALDPQWVALLDEYLAQYSPRDAIFNCTARNLEYVLEDIGLGAEVPQKISFEMMRWTCAVRDYQAGIEPETIREKLGLSKISWSETFSKIRRLAGEKLDYTDGDDLEDADE
jgi:integrase/recombinase XerD